MNVETYGDSFVVALPLPGGVYVVPGTDPGATFAAAVAAITADGYRGAGWYCRGCGGHYARVTVTATDEGTVTVQARVTGGSVMVTRPADGVRVVEL